MCEFDKVVRMQEILCFLCTEHNFFNQTFIFHRASPDGIVTLSSVKISDLGTFLYTVLSRNLTVVDQLGYW